MLLVKDKLLYKDMEIPLALGKELLIHQIESYKFQMKEQSKRDPIEHYKARIKDHDSMVTKLKLNGFPISQKAAVTDVYDLIGVRIVVTFINDIYDLINEIGKTPGVEVINIKDYVKTPKPNGYRSVHLITKLPVEVEGISDHLYAEIQIRTIAMDCWASLEHQLKYKKGDIKNPELIIEELRRCATEIASTDLTLQAIQEMIEGD